MPLNNDESEAVRNFLKVFGANTKIDNEAVGMALFGQKQMLDVNSSREYVDRFFQKCEKRDPSASKTLTRRANSLMNSSDTLIYAMEFIVRCRQSHLFYHKSNQTQYVENPSGITRTSSNMGGSAQSSPFQRRSASRTRVFSNLTAENQLLNESTRSRANTSFNSYDNRHLAMERSSQISRPKSPFRIVNSSDLKTPTSASNHLFSSQFRTPQSQEPSPYRTSSSNFTNGSSISSSSNTVRVGNSAANIPLHARMGGAICETESTVCECLLAALLGIGSRLFRSDGARKMTICSTASLSTTHVGIAYRILETANIYQHLSHRDPLLYSSNSSSAPLNEPISSALLAGIRHLLGEYTADIDGLRRNRKNLRFSGILPIIDLWNVRLILMMKCFSLRKLEQIDLLEAIFIIHRQYSFEPNRLFVAEKLIEYTMGVFCKQMIEWMKTGEIPTEKWVIYKETAMKIRKIPVFLTNSDMKMLLEIGKSLSKIDSSSDEDLLAIEQATNCVTRQLSWKTIQNRELSGLLRILRDVVCGIVMRTIMSTGRLKDHLNMATSIFFLNNPKFTATLYSVMKDASMGLRVGTTSLSRQTVSIALAAAIESSTRIMFEEEKDRKKKKLQFKLDALTSLGNTPNVSSRMQFIQPLRPKYEPVLDLVKPVFLACDDFYEAIFHVIWSIDLARLSSQETASKLPEMCRFLEKNYSLRENARSLLRMLGNIAFVINSTLLKVRNVIGIRVHLEFRRLLAAIDEKCVDVDDLIEEHVKFVKKVANLVFLEENDKIEPQLSVFLQTTFEAQKMIDEFCSIWHQIIDENFEDQNVLKAKMAEISKNWVVKIRVLMDKINTIQKKLIDDLDHQIMYGKE